MIPFPHLITTIISIFIIVYPTKAQTQTKLSCKSIPYPFGFTDSYPIRLNCNNNSDSIELKQFKVTNITSKRIFLNLPALCNRSIELLKPLFDSNNSYLPTGQNTLLLQNCRITFPNDCVSMISSSRDRFDLKSCESKRGSDHNNISCFTQQSTAGNKNSSFMRFEEFNATGCKSFYSSVFVDSESDSPTLSLQLAKFELEWWLSGTCGSNSTSICSKYSLCDDVKSSNGGTIGFRCRCKDGLRGDGYTHGQGCRKRESHISSLTIVAIVAIVASISVSVVLFLMGYCFLVRRKAKKKYGAIQEEDASKESWTVESLQFDFATIEAATNKFSDDNKLGEGGFGQVYKGILPNGQEIAVKRLSRSSGQGAGEFKNEVVLVAKLQHRNLVRLLGFCLEGEEKILVYEFVPNKSFDYFLYDPEKNAQLNWSRRYKIIGGIARGILYLHEDSRLRIIHRDLKASNVLLDADMNPKISDFGTARLFGVDQTQGNTSRVVGTFGYMAPEYVMHGRFSVKSDVYSFGVLILEILSGKRTSSFYQLDGAANLLSYAWRHWRDETLLEFLDPTLCDSYSRNEVIRCLQIGLLCVQDDPVDRPTMASIVLLLNSYSMTLSSPKQPVYFLHSRTEENMPLKESESMQGSVNEASITEEYPR